MKQYKKVLVIAACVLTTLLLACLERTIVKGLSFGQLASDWSKQEEYAQIACYFDREAGFFKEQILGIERSITEKMEQAAVPVQNENGGRNFTDAYSAKGELFISSNRANITVRAFGVGGDFFLFHPMTLLSGSYFGSTDESNDGVIIDEVVAWQLFGSNNVAGMEVEINGVAYPIRGVVRSEKGMFSKAVEEDAATIYVSYPILEAAYGGSHPIDSYEVLIANPVKEFGITTIKEALTMEEKRYEVVEASARFDFLHRLTILKQFGKRSMNTKNIVYPYWENRARGYEDVSALFLVFEMLCLCYPVLIALKQLRKLYKNRKTYAQKCKELLKNRVKTLKLNTKKSMEDELE